MVKNRERRIEVKHFYAERVRGKETVNTFFEINLTREKVNKLKGTNSIFMGGIERIRIRI